MGRALKPSTVDPGWRWFITLWVMAFSLHYLDGNPLAPIPLALGALAVPCLVAPSPIWSGVLLAACAAAIAIEMPAPANHLILAFVMILTLGASAGLAIGRHKPQAPDRGTLVSEWLDIAGLPVFLTLLAIYFFAILHKLNSSFFDPSVSCASLIVYRDLGLLGIHGEVPPTLIVVAAIAAVGCEFVILVLLAVPRLRRWGLLVGTLFHGILGTAGFADFSTFAFVVYVLLEHRRVATIEHAERWRRRGIALWLVHITLVVIAPRVTAYFQVRSPWMLLSAMTWLMTVSCFMVPLLQSVLRSDDERVNVRSLRLATPWLLILPALAIFNGMTPYLGLKTVANYSMFSNLRTEEGRTNHFVSLLSGLELTNFQRETVDVIEIRVPSSPRLTWFARFRGGQPWLERKTRWMSLGDPERVRIPWLELRRTVLLWQAAGVDDLAVTYSRHGIERQVAAAGHDPELAAPLPWWARYLLAFRAIEVADAPVNCRW